MHKLVNDKGFVRDEVRVGMHELPQVGRLAHEDLVKHLALFGCTPVKFMLGLWNKDNNVIDFTKVADGFGVKFFNME